MYMFFNIIMIEGPQGRPASVNLLVAQNLGHPPFQLDHNQFCYTFRLYFICVFYESEINTTQYKTMQ